jgi:O-antigen/teichoic acid export membrane protein
MNTSLVLEKFVNLLSKVKGESRKITWAVLDQAVVSLANFSLNFGLARFSTPEVFGTYVIVFTLLLFVYSTLQVSLTLDPLIILGGRKKEQNNFGDYIGETFALNLLISLVSSGILLIISLVLRSLSYDAYSKATLLATVPLVFMNLRFYFRAFYIMKGRFDKAFMHDAVVLITICLLISPFIYSNTLSEWAAVMILTLGEGSAVLIAVVNNRKGIPSTVLHLIERFKEWNLIAFLSNWEYGKWLLMANGASYVYQNAQFLLLPIFVSLSALAGYRASYMLVQPIYVFTTGLEAFAWNSAAERMRMEGARGLRSFIFEMGFPASLLVILYILVVGVSSNYLMEIVYAGKYTEFSGLIWFFGVAFLFALWSKMFGAVFRALGSTDIIFYNALFSGMLGFILLNILAKNYGVAGAALSFALSACLTVLLLSVFWIRWRNLTPK